MRIEEVNSENIKNVDNKELLNLHFRLHQIAGAMKDKKDKREGLSWEDLVNAHVFVVNEMIRRNMKHNSHDALDKDTEKLINSEALKIMEPLKNLENEVVVVPNFICIVGSAAKEDDFEDIDILIRSDKEGNNYLVRADNVYLPIRNVFRNLGKKVHIIDNPQGSHGDFIALYDLVLRRKPSFEVEVVKSNGPIKIDLGCGPNKPEGYIGIDKEQYDGVDIIADLELGIPLPDNYADEVRAWHFLEHVEDRDFIMSEIWRVLKPGGKLIFEVPSTNSEGAFVPGHKSFWNKTVFYFYSQPELAGNRPLFEIESLEEIERNGYKYVQGVLVKPDYAIACKILKPIGSPGGNYYYIKELLKIFPEHKIYVEPFAGGATAFWSKEPSEKEVLNDINQNIARFYRVLKNLTDKDIQRLRNFDYANSEDRFYQYLEDIKNGIDDDIEFLYKFKYVNYFSYGNNNMTYSHTTKRKGCSLFLKNLEKYRDRLKNTTILNKDGIEVIKEYDSKDTFFFIDPPWFEDLFEYGEFNKEKFRDIVEKLEGKALIIFRGDLGIQSFNKSRIKAPRFFVSSGKGTMYVDVYTNYDIEAKSKDGIEPFDNITPAKPKMKMFSAQTEAFNPKEILTWFELHKDNGVVAEEKLNGFRALIHKRNNKVMIYFEDAQKERNIKELVEALKEIDANFILDCDIGIIKDGKRQPRLYLMKLLSDEPEFSKNEYVVATLFDILYLGEDITDLPFAERREILEEFYEKYLKVNKNFAITDQIEIEDKKDLERAWKELGFRHMSEGIVLKDLSAEYEFGATNALAKVKHACEIKVIVLEVKENKNGTYSVRGGLLKGDSDFVANEDGYIDLGYSFNTPLEVKKGDIVTAQVQEIIIRQDKKGNKHLDWLGATIVDIDKTRKEPYYANQVIDLARRANVLQVVEDTSKALEEDDGTRNSKAVKFWNENWYRLYPRSGKGRFIYHLHIRGLTEDEIDLGLKELLERGHSVHGDLRLETDEGLWGITVFEGKAEELLKEEHFTRLANLLPDDNLQFTFKLIQPKEWLRVGVKKPYISKPGGVGATSKKYAKFFAIDTGTYDVGVWREHMIEIFLNGKILKGRYLLEYAPIGNSRVWIIDKPKDQTPYAEKKRLEDVIKELEAKKQKYLVWSKPNMKPKLYKIEAKSEEDVKEYFFEVAKVNEEERFVLAPFAVPYSPDLKNHRIVNPSKLEKALHDFVAFNGAVYYNHEIPLDKVRIAEAYITRDEIEINGKKFPKGTAFIGFKILDDELWKMIKSGLIKGVSYRAVVRKAGKDN